MIRLVVEEYCHGCRNFEPVCDTRCLFGDDGTVKTYVDVECKNKKQCDFIKKFLEKRIKYE